MQSSTFSNQFLFSAVFIPFTILTSYLTFIRRKYGFTKHLVTMLYLTSCFFLVFMILYDLIVWLWSDYLIEFIAFPVMAITIFTWNSIALTPKNKYFKIILNTILEIIVFITLVSFIYGFLYYTELLQLQFE